MTDERRYRDDEIRRIFDLATRGDEVSTPSVAPQDGLTLGQLQDVGREVGLAPERVARAALSLDAHEEVLPRRTTLGMPTSVGRVVELPRALTDHEWELLVAELRTTFGAKGHVTSHGSLREWSNGNLHALIEPTESGHRLRMTTRKGSAMELNLVGGVMLLFALLTFVILAAKGDAAARYVIPIFFALIGSGALATNALSLPRWAAEREEQMEYIASRVKGLLGPGTTST